MALPGSSIKDLSKDGSRFRGEGRGRYVRTPILETLFKKRNIKSQMPTESGPWRAVFGQFRRIQVEDIISAKKAGSAWVPCTGPRCLVLLQ